MIWKEKMGKFSQQLEVALASGTRDEILDVLWSVRKNQTPQLERYLPRLLKHPNSWIRRACADLIGIFKLHDCSSLLVNALDDSNYLVRPMAAASLLRLDRSNATIIKKQLPKIHDKTGEYSMYCSLLYIATSESRYMKRLKRWLKHYRHHPRVFCGITDCFTDFEACSMNQETVRIFDLMLSYCEPGSCAYHDIREEAAPDRPDTSWSVPLEAIEPAKGKVGMFSKQMDSCLASKEDWCDVADLFEDIRKDQIPQLKRYLPCLLRHPEMVIRCEALELIADFELREFYPALSEALKDPDEIVRHYAAATLLQVDPNCIPILKQQLALVQEETEESASLCSLLYIKTLEPDYINRLHQWVDQYQYVPMLFSNIKSPFKCYDAFGVTNESRSLFELMLFYTEPESAHYEDLHEIVDSFHKAK